MGLRKQLPSHYCHHNAGYSGDQSARIQKNLYQVHRRGRQSIFLGLLELLSWATCLTIVSAYFLGAVDFAEDLLNHSLLVFVEKLSNTWLGDLPVVVSPCFEEDGRMEAATALLCSSFKLSKRE